MIGATSRLMLLRCWDCNTEKDVLSGLYLHNEAPQIRLIRGSGTRYVAVVVPLAKLSLTKCPAVRGASEASDRNRDLRCSVDAGGTATLSKGVRVGNLMTLHCSYTLMPHMCVPPTWWLVQLYWHPG